MGGFKKPVAVADLISPWRDSDPSLPMLLRSDTANARSEPSVSVGPLACSGVAPTPDPLVTAPSLLGKFGVVKLWPGLKVAEDEVIARLCNTAASLGLTAVVVDHMGITIDPPHVQMTQQDLDFVIHLHFGTPKSYDIFSFVVLWNPLQFYHDFGYRRVTRHLLTHDDFLSCGSPAADDQIARMILNDPTHAPPRFTMFHSLSEPILAPTLGDLKLFYSGINWERVGKGGSRHQQVLDELDLTGKLRIYGPRVLHNVKVWEGYQSYQGSIPFDGRSVMREINRAGLALVLSSPAHVDSALMSNRLFEALAGGAVVICDQNPFARKNFGDTLLYIDTTAPADEIAGQILDHLRWVETNRQAALALARRAQALFQQNFRLDLSLSKIYDGFQARRAQLAALVAAPDVATPTTVFLLLPEYSADALAVQIGNATKSSDAGHKLVLVADAFDLKHFRPRIEAALAAGGASVELASAAFFDRAATGKKLRATKFGRIVQQLVESAGAPDRLLCFVAPNERMFANHLPLLIGALSRNPNAAYAYSGVLLSYADEKGATSCEVHEELDLLAFTRNFPVGCCRFLFRSIALGPLADVMLPYLDVAAIAGMAFYADGVSSHRVTAVIDIEHAFNVGEKSKTGADDSKSFADRLAEDHDIIRDVDPQKFDRVWQAAFARPSRHLPGTKEPTAEDHLAPLSLYIDRLSRKNRQILLAQLLQSLPLPRFIWSMLRPLRPWRRGQSVKRLTDKAP